MDSKTYWIGMQDWKINQKIFDAIGIKQDILGVHISDEYILHVDHADLIPCINKQFENLVDIYIPAKSYCVALVYAAELTKDYGGSMIDYLSDQQLLFNDLHFVPYTQDQNTYDYFMQHTHWIQSPMADKIREYYRKEIHLEGINEHHN